MKTLFPISALLFCFGLLMAVRVSPVTITPTNLEIPTGSFPAVSFPTSRDPIYWPFAADSIWNMPIHNNAVYVDSGLDLHMPLDAGPTTDQEILILSPGSPVVPVQESFAGFDGLDRCDTANLTGATLFEAPVPENWSTGGGSEGNMSGAILLEDYDTVIETQPLHVCSEGGLVTSGWAWSPESIRTGGGITGSHGGSGMSSLGGSIRYNELLPGSVIYHALKMNFYARYAYSYTGDTPGYRWPAPTADGYASPETYGGTVPAMVLGSLLALEPNFDITSLQTEPARIIAQAAQDYGIYAVDDTYWDVFGLLVEWGTDGSSNRSVTDQFQATYGYGIDDGPLLNCTEASDACRFSQDMWNIISHLKVIDNNTATTIGGGPNSDTVNRRAPLAPAFSPPPTATPGPSRTPRPTATATLTPTITPTFAPGEWIPVDDSDSGWVWSGWEQYRDGQAYGQTAHGSPEAGDYGEYTFTGTGVEVYTWKGSDGGNVEVFIDGISEGIFSLYADPDQYNQLLYSNADLSGGSHTIRIVAVDGAWCMVDYIRYK